MCTELSNIPHSTREQLINEWIFNARNREIIRLKLLEGYTHESIAEQVDMSPRQIKNIVRECTDVLVEKLNNT
jgi:DNA-directed RNA polymerase specialized sigma24 family protein